MSADASPRSTYLRSLSRTVPGCLLPDEAAAARAARAILAQAAELTDLVRLGAYQPGADTDADRALRLAPRIEALITQSREHDPAPASIEGAFARLQSILDDTHGQ